jgi:hypothetical protein
MTWEEREPTLDTWEEELRATWRVARRRHGHDVGHVLTLSHMNALRRAFPDKAAAYEALNRWARRAVDVGRADEAASTGAPPEPAGPPRLTQPSAADAALVARFGVALDEALPSLTKMLGRRLAGHMVLFDDGDYVCFEGLVERGDEERPKMVRIDNILASRFQGGRRRVYGRLVPGATVDVLRETIRAGEGSGRWEEKLRHGDEYHVLSFGPAPA